MQIFRRYSFFKELLTKNDHITCFVMAIKLILLFIFISSPLFASEFIENRGQWDADVRYKTESAGMTAWIMPGSVIYDYSKMEVNGRDTSLAGHVIKCSLAGTSAVPEFAPSGRNKIVRNYFTGNDPTKWAKHVASYSAVTAKDIYPGTDIRYYFDATGMRYDFILHPGADPENIRMEFTGQDYIDIDVDGSLVLGTSLGEIKHGQIFAYQESGKPGDSRLSAVPCRFVLNTDGSVGLSPGNYDPDLPLVIDPLVYSTYFGGRSNDMIQALEEGKEGTIYAVGRSKSNDIVGTPGAYTEKNETGSYCNIFFKLDKDADFEVITFFGNGGLFHDTYSAFYHKDKLYIAGVGALPNFFINTDSYDDDGQYDSSNDEYPKAFIACFNNNLDSLYAFTHFGKLKEIRPFKIKVIDNNVILSGQVKSFGTEFPFTNTFIHEQSPNSLISFISVFDTNLTSLYRCIGIGGWGNTHFVDFFEGNNNSFTCFGNTNSYNLPYTNNALDSIYGGYGENTNMRTDMIIANISNDFNDLNYLSYLGGNQTDSLFNVLRESDTTFLLYGYTRSGEFPGIPQGEDVGFQDADIILAEMDDRYNIKKVHLLGDENSDDRGSSISWSNTGGFIMSGLTWGKNFPVTEDAYQHGKTEPFIYENPDIFVLDISRNCDTIKYATYLGGSSWELWPYGAKYDTEYFIGGMTLSPNFPVTEDAFQSEYTEDWEMYFSKFHFDHPSPVIEELSQTQNISTYPNPFRDSFTFVLENNSETEIQAVLYNIQGIETARTIYTNLTSGTFSLPFRVPEIPSGAYVLKISTGGKIVSSCKVVKE